MTRKKHMSFIMNVDRGVYPRTHTLILSWGMVFSLFKKSMAKQYPFCNHYYDVSSTI